MTRLHNGLKQEDDLRNELSLNPTTVKVFPYPPTVKGGSKGPPPNLSYLPTDFKIVCVI